MEETEEYIVEYNETMEGESNTNQNDSTRSNIRVQPPESSKLEKQSQIYTCFVKQEPTIIEENSNLRSNYENDEENNLSSSIQENTISDSINSSSIQNDTIVPETIVPDLENSEPKKRGRPKKKPLSILTPMEISNIHDEKTSGEVVENNSEQLYAGFLGRTRRTTRQNREWSEGSDLEDDDVDYSERKGRPYGSVKNRGRGRGRVRNRGTRSTRGRRSRENENAEVTVTFEEGVIGQEAEEETAPVPAEPAKNMRKVICGKCQEELVKRDWNRHNLMKHNDTGWIEGNKPVDDSDEKLLKKLLSLAIKKRKGQLTCEQCGIQKRSAVGFLSHIRFCGKTDSERLQLMIQCPRCNSKIKPTSVYTHEKNCQKEKLNLSYDYQNELEENLDCTTSQGRSKRKAAQKAVTKISEFTSEIIPHSEKITPTTIYNFIKRPQLKRKIKRSLRNAFQKELEETGIARCRQQCNYYGVTLEIICDHYTKCNFQPQENYVCKVCNLHSKIQKEIKDHIIDKHSVFDNIDMDPDHDLKNEDTSESSEDENENAKEKSSNLRFLPDKPEEKLRAFRAVFLDRELVQNPKGNVPYTAAYRWTLEFELNNYQLNLFEDLLPNEFKLLSNEEADDFLPELKRSMAVKSLIDTGNEWNYWQRFEGKVEDDVPMFFVGGPVWAMAWLPIPFKFYSQQLNQYLAISTHPKMESEYLMGQAYAGKNVIQIWNLGNLQQNNNEFSNPELCYAIAHNGGTIWCMECCPSGCYQNADSEDALEKMKRLGLLAVACSDGFVYIYSLPFPEQLEGMKSKKIELPIYKVNPVQLLVVNISLNEKEKPTWQCTKLSWTKEKGHNVLAAGFSNGYIALWNLTTQSPFLKKKQGNITILNSFRHFYAHHHAVSMISMIPYGGKRFLASAGIDRYYKVWDLEQINCLDCMPTKGFTVDGSWLNNWPCSILGYDDALSLSHTNSQLIPLREHSYRYFPVLATNSPTYGIGVSDLANAIAQGSLAGEIVAIFPNQILYRDIENYLNKKRWLCSYVEVTDFQSPENPLVEDQNKKDKKEYHYKPSTYNECSERFGISFSDNFKTFRTCKARKLTYKVMPADQMENVAIEQYPFASINRISWSPNAWSYLWLAAGYQNGFVRILNFNSVTKTDPIDKILPRFVEKLLQYERMNRDNNGPRHVDENCEEEDERNNCQEENDNNNCQE